MRPRRTEPLEPRAAKFAQRLSRPGSATVMELGYPSAAGSKVQPGGIGNIGERSGWRLPPTNLRCSRGELESSFIHLGRRFSTARGKPPRIIPPTLSTTTGPVESTNTTVTATATGASTCHHHHHKHHHHHHHHPLPRPPPPTAEALRPLPFLPAPRRPRSFTSFSPSQQHQRCAQTTATATATAFRPDGQSQDHRLQPATHAPSSDQRPRALSVPRDSPTPTSAPYTNANNGPHCARPPPLLGELLLPPAHNAQTVAVKRLPRRSQPQSRVGGHLASSVKTTHVPAAAVSRRPSMPWPSRAHATDGISHYQRINT